MTVEIVARIFDRHCERSEAIHSATQRIDGLLRRFAPRNDGKHRPEEQPRKRSEMGRSK
jgi:hypothetical protein